MIKPNEWGMTIKEPLQSLNLSKVDSIALHHMDSNADIKTIEKAHLNKGWKAIGYNYWVAFNGDIYEGRGLNLGAGVENQNGHIISIGFQGDYNTSAVEMPNTQFNSGIECIEYIKNKIGRDLKVGGHKDFMPTACPGRYFPLNEIISEIKREEQPTMIENVEQAIIKLVEKNIIGSPDYWITAYQVVKNLDKLLINMANALNK